MSFETFLCFCISLELSLLHCRKSPASECMWEDVTLELPLPFLEYWSFTLGRALHSKNPPECTVGCYCVCLSDWLLIQDFFVSGSKSNHQILTPQAGSAARCQVQARCEESSWHYCGDCIEDRWERCCHQRAGRQVCDQEGDSAANCGRVQEGRREGSTSSFHISRPRRKYWYMFCRA